MKRSLLLVSLESGAYIFLRLEMFGGVKVVEREFGLKSLVVLFSVYVLFNFLPVIEGSSTPQREKYMCYQKMSNLCSYFCKR
jgi:hypothetical protein